MNNFAITITTAIASLLAVSTIAVAQEPPVLFGDYSANVAGAVNLTGPAVTSTHAMTFGYPTAQPAAEPAPFGNYSANVRREDVIGR
ncbi:MAG: hypothetical protein K5872_04005 [Rhizobiaceae bacterium]|nr:hypothetical protein [Rhizobiaceae bacterium]MCV0405375.1 hypothetical protein [Rhizobiaceae bacterium]